MKRFQWCMAVLALNAAAGWCVAQDPASPDTKQPAPALGSEQLAAPQLESATGAPAAGQAHDKSALYDKFSKLMTGAKMTGLFTIDGKPLQEQTAETYTIEKVEKLPDGDAWVITARIQYGKRDLTIPVPIDVKWAGTTPVLTLDDLTLPGFGTFSARVVLHKDKYAGTWQHGDVGGHMFGLLHMQAESSSAPAAPVAEVDSTSNP